MKYLIIPDVHNRFELVEKIINRVKPDLTIFLGDFFDDFHDNPLIIEEVACWFKESIHKKDRIHLCGNHDVHYWFKDNKKIRCSGYEDIKSIRINDIITTKEWEKLKFYYVLDNKWLLSHAGVHPSWVNDNFSSSKLNFAKPSKVIGKLRRDSIEVVRKLYAGDEHWFVRAGFSRSLLARNYGGLLWCDWREEFMPIIGINQIVGHTPQRSVDWINVAEGDSKYNVFPLKDSNVVITAGDSYIFDPRHNLSEKSSYNLCLDTHPGSQYYATYEEGLLTIHESSNI